MGMIARRTLVHLDSDVVVGLALDDAARACVQDYRNDGAQILLSLAVLRELARASRPKRAKLVDAACRYCHGFANLPAWGVLALEIRGINECRPFPGVPIVPIRELRRALADDAIASLPKRPSARQTKDLHVQVLDTIKREWPTETVEPTFEAFLTAHRGRILKMLVDAGLRAGTIPRPVALPVHGDTTGLAAFIGITAANVYRKLTGSILKGGGCFSDLFNIIEVAHSDILLTRDRELFECGQLLRKAVRDARPDVRLVPLPACAPYRARSAR